MGDPAVFIMSDNLICTINTSSDKAEIGNRIALIGLSTPKPKVKFENGVTSPMQKVFESEKTLTILLIATGSGSVDTFVINKVNGQFSNAAAGNLLGVYSSAALGTCQ